MSYASQLNIAKGKMGEDFATKLYEKSGFEILHRDLRVSRAQIDIVAKRGNLICFIEAKYRKTIHEAHAALKSSQLKRISQAAEIHMQSHPDSIWQVDAILIDHNMNWQRIDNIQYTMQI